MKRNFITWVVIDPEDQQWTSTLAESIQGAAEQAALDYDARPDVDYALSKQGVVAQVLVRDPTDETSAFSFSVSCVLNPFYEISGNDGKLKLS